MTQKNRITRRDFLKMGAMTALSLPVMQKMDQPEGQKFFTYEDTYGGFLIQTLAEDDPPIIVDDARYKRFDATNMIFSRIVWDEEYIQKLEEIEKVFQPDDPGYEQIDAALGSGAVFCAGYDGTFSFMAGRHAGLLSLNPGVLTKPGVTFEGPWDYSQHSPEEVSEIVKKAALFLGASLVGIAPMNERWIYSHAFDMLSGGASPIEITEVTIPDLPEGQISLQEAREIIRSKMEQMDGEDIKTMLIDVLINIDPALLPPEAPPVGMVRILPAGQFKQRISKFLTMPKPILEMFAEKLGLDVEIADIDLGEAARPRYLTDGTLAIPETMKHVIVLAFEMDYDSIEAAPTLLGDHATMDGYSKMAITAGSLAQFIRELGYQAIPCGNNTGVSVAQAIEAGLGEGGRNGILITPKYGPRVRLAKVITDLPMANDKPIRFGVKEFCDVCKKCAKHCPSQAISYGEKSMEGATISNNPAVLKWSVNPEDCYLSWEAHGSGCAVCIRVCPFNKPEGWLHEATRILIGAKSGSLDSLLVRLDDASGYGAAEPNFTFWDSNDYIHIKG